MAYDRTVDRWLQLDDMGQHYADWQDPKMV